jgi:hypothetical protein
MSIIWRDCIEACYSSYSIQLSSNGSFVLFIEFETIGVEFVMSATKIIHGLGASGIIMKEAL